MKYKMMEIIGVVGGGAAVFSVYTNAVSPSVFDPSWGFSAGGGPMTVDWGDGSAKETHATELSHTYGAGTGQHKAVFTCADWSKVTTFDVNSDLCANVFPDFLRMKNVTYLAINSNSWLTALPSLATLTNLVTLYFDSGVFTGPLPLFTNTSIQTFRGRYNQFSGALPSMAALTDLRSFDMQACRFSGTLPSFAACTLMTSFNIQEQSVNGGFTGTLPSFAACTQLLTFSIHSNNFSGTIPSFAACTKLTSWIAGNGAFNQANLFTDYEVGGFATQKSLATLKIAYNHLSDAAINSILDDLVTSLSISGRVTCTVNLYGADNGFPDADGLTAIATLRAAGWTVTFNEHPFIVMIGDSITQGSPNWVDIFHPAYLSGRNTVWNLAVGGCGILAPSYNKMSTQVASHYNHDADYVIILLGTNDSATDDTIRAEYETQLNAIKVLNPTATIYGLGIINRTVMTGIVARNAQIATACANASVTYVDTSSWIVAATDLSDGTHPNATGATKIANAVIAMLPA